LKPITITQKKSLTPPKTDEEKHLLFLKHLKQFEREDIPIIYLGEKCFGQYNWPLKNQTNAIGAIDNNQLFAIGL
jgi:hypothetical protein